MDKKKRQKIPYHQAKHDLLNILVTRVSVCCACEKRKGRAYLFIGNIQFIPFIFKLKLDFFSLSRHPFFSMFVFKVWKCIDTHRVQFFQEFCQPLGRIYDLNWSWSLTFYRQALCRLGTVKAENARSIRKKYTLLKVYVNFVSIKAWANNVQLQKQWFSGILQQIMYILSVPKENGESFFSR